MSKIVKSFISKKKKKKAMLFKFVNLYSVLAGPYRTNHLSLEIMLNPPKRRTKYLYNSKGFSFMPEPEQINGLVCI